MRVRPTTEHVLRAAFGDQFVFSAKRWGNTAVEGPHVDLSIASVRIRRLPSRLSSGRQLLFLPGFLPPEREFCLRLPLLADAYYKNEFSVNLLRLSGVDLKERVVTCSLEQMKAQAIRLFEAVLKNPRVKHVVVMAESLGCLTVLQALSEIKSQHVPKIVEVVLFSPLLAPSELFNPNSGKYVYDQNPEQCPGLMSMHRVTVSGERRVYRIDRKFYDSALKDPGIDFIDGLPKKESLPIHVILPEDDPFPMNQERLRQFKGRRSTVDITTFSWPQHVFWGDMIYALNEAILEPLSRQTALKLTPVPAPVGIARYFSV